VVDIVLDSEELTVLGGPSQVSVQVDLGADGDRGSIFLVGSGLPVTDQETNILIGTGIIVQPFDVYINTQNKKMYQYILADGGTPTWVEFLSIIPNNYSINKTAVFTEDGETTISDISINDIVDSNFISQISSLTSANFNVQCSIVGSLPIASSVSVSNPTGGNLPITLSAIEFDGTTWSNLSGEKTVHLFITVV
jgi:hypothetical protein